MGKMKTVAEIIEEISPRYEGRAKKKKEGLLDGSAEGVHKIVYDSASDQLEPLYFFLLDLINDFGFETEKLVDNFSSSIGSGHFGEFGQRKGVMQQQATQMLGQVNTVLRSVLNLIYDLKEFNMRLQTYDDFKGKDKNKSEAARQVLKQIWLDKVDVQKGQGSIHAMTTGQLSFVTLRDAFLSAKDVKHAKDLDLNERVKRIVIARIHEFENWLKESEIELRKRYKMEKTYLKSQVNSLKLYSRWAKPYMKAAQQLEMSEGGRNPALVKAFNTIVLELTMLGKQKIDPKKLASAGVLPSELLKVKGFGEGRKYYSCTLLDFNFRGIPQRMQSQQGGYVFGGRTEITFRAYALNEDEIAKLNEELEKSDIENALGLIEGTTTESLEQLKDDIEYFLSEGPLEEGEEKKEEDQSNPFKALIGGYNKTAKKKGEKNSDEKEPVEVRKETWIESEHIRSIAAEEAKALTFKFFDIYKKAHGMASWT